MARVAVVAGTRPEVIKLAPVLRALRETDGVQAELVVSGQHRELVQPMLMQFGLTPDVDLDVMQPDQTLARLSARLLERFDALYSERGYALVLVQGDTTTALMAAQAAFYRQIGVGHVEAGMRTFQRYNPFPEEINRSLIARLASLHFAAHENHRQHLLREGVDPAQVYLTGNPVIDALHETLARQPEFTTPELNTLFAGPLRTVLVTTHRRESFGEPMRNTLAALVQLVERYKDVQVVLPVHLNPRVREVVYELLAGAPRVHLLEPLGYADFVRAMHKAVLMLTDSGGVQEEAPALGTPVVVLRETTERPEVVDAGVAELVGTDTVKILQAAERVLAGDQVERTLASPYGDGTAGEQIASLCREYLTNQAAERGFDDE